MEEKTFHFTREDDKDRVEVFFNLAPDERRVPLDKNLHGINLYTGEEVDADGSGVLSGQSFLAVLVKK